MSSEDENMVASRVRVIDLETTGNGPFDVCEIGWQDVVRSEGAIWSSSDDHGARFVNPHRPISPETMAVHHIIDEHVADAPLWKTVAPEVLQPADGVVALAAHRAAFEQRYCPLGGVEAPLGYALGNSLRLWPQLQSFFSNQMLRYQRMPVGLVHEVGLEAVSASVK